MLPWQSWDWKSARTKVQLEGWKQAKTLSRQISYLRPLHAGVPSYDCPFYKICPNSHVASTAQLSTHGPQEA